MVVDVVIVPSSSFASCPIDAVTEGRRSNQAHSWEYFSGIQEETSQQFIQAPYCLEQ